MLTKETKTTFEDFRNQNGMTFWWASDLMNMLGYKDMKSFQNVLDRATRAFVSLNISHYENIITEMRQTDDKLFRDFKLTRFACYIAVMNADPKKKEVAIAQSYFAEQTRNFELYIESQNEMDRLLYREDLKEGNKALSSAASKTGVTDFPRFQNAGYIGLYNMPLWQLKKKRRLTSNASIADFMGRTELAANLFRVTQTEERIKNKNVTGQTELENTHHQVSREVRKLVRENVGRTPENLPIEKRLPEVKKELKKSYKKMLKADE